MVSTSYILRLLVLITLDVIVCGPVKPWTMLTLISNVNVQHLSTLNHKNIPYSGKFLRVKIFTNAQDRVFRKYFRDSALLSYLCQQTFTYNIL